MASQYNQIFEKLVLSCDEDSSDRLIGMLAYAEYKLEKCEWVKKNLSATKTKKDAFLDSYTDRRLDKLRDEASTTLSIFAEDYAEKRLSEELQTGISQQIREATKKDLWGFCWGVFQGVAASAVFSLCLFFLALSFSLAQPESNFGKIFQFLVSSDKYELQLIERD
ncbi:hypothetical protein FEK30_04160 [Picosynechococcus sp. PCC 11901]|uniref:hypothetical protein n=1 Tax=Picosynechococcus sp. PCC 11901 TaxID=2579791 RepID=UPI0010FC0B6C|nr:hypothetical protein [Picosynechococcus sp. PCC 11901]QCS48692.1 hypothetical protein FEK30_04160 [Picosynechococcus sp. PCC 11901]